MLFHYLMFTYLIVVYGNSLTKSFPQIVCVILSAPSITLMIAYYSYRY